MPLSTYLHGLLASYYGRAAVTVASGYIALLYLWESELQVKGASFILTEQ